MGLGDFVDDLVPEAVENVAGAAVGGVADFGVGVGRGAQTAAGLVGDIAQGAGWVANPYHWDDIQHGVGAAGSFLVNNPGKVWDVGFEVGRHIVKEEILDPQNLAINVGLLAATTLTGGAAGAAWAAKIGKGVRSGASAFKAARATGEGMSVARGTRAALETMRASEAAFKAVRAERIATTGLRGSEAIAEGTSAAGRIGSKITDVAEFMPRQFAKAREFVTGNELSYLQRGRRGLAESFEGSSPGMMREAVGDVIRGSAFRPGTAGLGAGGAKLARGTYAVNRGRANVSHVEAVEDGQRRWRGGLRVPEEPRGLRRQEGRDRWRLTSALSGPGTTCSATPRSSGRGKRRRRSSASLMLDRLPMATPRSPSPRRRYRAYRGQQASRSLGTSESEYVESDFAVGRLDQFQRGMYDPRSIYETAGAR